VSAVSHNSAAGGSLLYVGFGPATATSGQRVSRPDPERPVSADERIAGVGRKRDVRNRSLASISRPVRPAARRCESSPVSRIRASFQRSSITCLKTTEGTCAPFPLPESRALAGALSGLPHRPHSTPNAVTYGRITACRPPEVARIWRRWGGGGDGRWANSAGFGREGSLVLTSIGG